MEKELNFGANNWVWQGWNYIKIKNWEAITGAIKRN
jgi:hypothetical protein